MNPPTNKSCFFNWLFRPKSFARRGLRPRKCIEAAVDRLPQRSRARDVSDGECIEAAVDRLPQLVNERNRIAY